VAIQYSISYDDKGSPSLVKNTIKGSTPVIKSSFNIGEYKPTRTIQTDFENITEQKAETVYQSLQKYIYQTTKNSDGKPDDNTKSFLEQSFQAAAARDIDGKVIGDSTLKEKAKMTAVSAYLTREQQPIKSALLSNVPIIGTIYKAFAHAGSQYVDSYYDPADDYYYSTGFGMYDDSSKAIKARDDRLQSSGGVKIDNAYMYATDYQGGTGPSDVNAGAKALAQTYQDIGRTRDNDGSSGHAGGSAAAEGAASQASDDAAAGAGGY
tara:strand:- start:478 stop:1275 length:798 start_codon:yes stop_codon:yes gene_type:complete